MEQLVAPSVFGLCLNKCESKMLKVENVDVQPDYLFFSLSGVNIILTRERIVFVDGKTSEED